MTDAAPWATRRTDGWRERAAQAAPLLVVGGVFIVGAVYLYVTGATTSFGAGSSVHLEPWVLFLALGITAGSAGTLVVLSPEEEDETPLVSPRAPSPVGIAPQDAVTQGPVPEWDESSIVSDRPHPPTIWRSPDDAELMTGTIAEPAPPDDVLRTLDDLEASLRKKPRSLGSDVPDS